MTNTFANKITVDNRTFTLDWGRSTRGARTITQVVRENGKAVAFYDYPKNNNNKTCTLRVPTGRNEKTGFTINTTFKCKAGELALTINKAIEQGLI